MKNPGRADRREGWLRLCVVALIALVLAHVFFRVASDLQWGDAPGHESPLKSWEVFEARYFDEAGSVHVSRFAGSHMVHALARAIESAVGTPADPRAHPLRIAATLFAIVCTLAGVAPFLFGRPDGAVGRGWSWPAYVSGYVALVVLGLQVWQPYDLPALACISLAAWWCLHERWWLALVALVVGGLFRENMLHVVVFAGTLALAAPSRARWRWTATFGVIWLAQWWLVQRVAFDARSGASLANLTSGWASPSLIQTTLLSLAAAGVMYGWIAHREPLAGPRRRLVLLLLASVPGWLVFYKFLGGNLSELRMTMPIWIPLLLVAAARPGALEPLLRSASAEAR